MTLSMRQFHGTGFCAGSVTLVCDRRWGLEYFGVFHIRDAQPSLYTNPKAGECVPPLPEPSCPQEEAGPSEALYLL